MRQEPLERRIDGFAARGEPRVERAEAVTGALPLSSAGVSPMRGVRRSKLSALVEDFEPPLRFFEPEWQKRDNCTPRS